MALITVSMAYYRTPETIDRAIQSILDQTFTDWRLSIIVDGCEPPEVREDPRIRMFHVQQNRGPFYCAALNLAVCDTPWWTSHDSDDYSDPDRLATLLTAADGYNGVQEPIIAHRLDGTTKVQKGNMTGLFQPELLRACGPHPDFRVSWDGALMALYSRAYRVNVLSAAKDGAAYHAVKRPDSLTVHPRTGMGSSYRRSVHCRRQALIDRCLSVSPGQWPHILRPKPETQAALEADIARYRSLIDWG